MMSCSTGDTGFVTLASAARKVLALESALLAKGKYPLKKQDAELNFTLNTH